MHPGRLSVLSSTFHGSGAQRKWVTRSWFSVDWELYRDIQTELSLAEAITYAIKEIDEGDLQTARRVLQRQLHFHRSRILEIVEVAAPKELAVDVFFANADSLSKRPVNTTQ